MKAGQQTRQTLLAIIRERGGIHKSELARLAQRGWGNLGHHLDVLSRAGDIELEVRGRLTWVFPADMPANQRSLIVATRPSAARRMLEALGLKRRATVSSLSHELDLSKKVIRSHLGSLERAGAVSKVQGRPPSFEVISAQEKP